MEKTLDLSCLQGKDSFFKAYALSRDSPLESNRERTDRQADCLLKVGYRWERCHLTGKHRKRFKPYIYISISINIYMNKAGRIYMYIYDQLYS